MQYSILVVDDEKDIVDSLERQFRKTYRVLKASSGHDALKVLAKEKVQLIISDQRMPEMTGVQFFERAQKLQPDAIRILLTGYTDVESVIAAINSGQVYRYITKPWDPGDLDMVVRKALETFELQVELKDKNAKLEAALNELKTLDEAKSHFMILIGHELKTPLTTISSFVELLREETLKAEQSKYVDRISQGVARLQEIVLDVLDLMSAETGATRVTKSKASVSEVASDAVAVFKDQAEKKNIKVKIDDGKSSAQFDSRLIGKCLRKIIHNAVKFARADSTVNVKFKNVDEGLEVLVTNSGPVISASKIKRILEPFSMDEEIMNHSQGMGLGLSVSQSILKRHGSKLNIDSSSDGGGKTTVSFILEN